MKRKICTLGGHRPNHLPFGTDESQHDGLKKQLEERILEKIREGYKVFYS